MFCNLNFIRVALRSDSGYFIKVHFESRTFSSIVYDSTKIIVHLELKH